MPLDLPTHFGFKLVVLVTYLMTNIAHLITVYKYNPLYHISCFRWNGRDSEVNSISWGS